MPTEAYLARRELTEAWNATPFDMERVARAMAVLLELCNHDIERFAFRGPYLAVDNGLGGQP